MLERATLDVLARAAEIGLPEAATVPAAAYDPFLRPIIKRRVLRAIAAASARTTQVNAGDHVLRLAFLSAHPSAPPIANADDPRAVATAFESLAAPYLPPRPAPDPERAGGAYRAVAAEREPVRDYVAPPRPKRKFWPVTTSLFALVLAIALGVAGVTFGPAFVRSPYEKFTGTPLGVALGEPLTDVVARSTPPEDRARAREALGSKQVDKQIGKEAASSLAIALDALPMATSSTAESTDEALEPLADAVNDLDRKLADARVPALLHAYGTGSTDRRSFWLTSYFVEERADVAIDGHPFRVAWGRRIDQLNLVDSPIYKGDLEDWAILSLSHLDEQLVQTLLAPLAFGKPMGPEEHGVGDTSPRAELARLASDVVSRELVSVTGVTREDAQGLQNAISHRNDAMVGLAKAGYAIMASSRIWLTPAMTAGLERTKARGGYAAKLAGEILRMNDRMKVHAKPLLPAISEMARLEEEQFIGRLAEEKRIRALQPSPELPSDEDADIARDGNDDSTNTNTRANTNMIYFTGSLYGHAVASGELASLARARTTPSLALWLLVRRSAQSGPTALVLRALFERLDLGAAATLRARDDFDRAATKAMAMPPERVRAAAARTYQEVFGRPAPPLARTKLP